MTILLEATFPNALDALVDRLSGPAWAGALVEAWVFEDFPARHAAELALATAGVSARIRSAYKPLLHAFLDEFELAGVTAIDIATPAHPSGSARRFALEAYPLAGLTRAPVRFSTGGTLLDYDVVLRHPAGDRHHRVFAPNKLGANGHLSPCGWLRISRAGVRFEDHALPTEFEQVFAAAMGAIAAYPWPRTQPIFATLEISVTTAGIERRILWHDECLSTREALHEDFYFSLLEFFQAQAGLEPGDRTLQPGQIIPDIRVGEGATTLRVALLPARVDPVAVDARPALATAGRPLRAGEIAAEMAALGGAPFSVTSTQGRPILGTYFAGAGRGFLLSGGQHANETSGVVGALRAAHDLKAIKDINFALIAQENVDGYALHQRLIQAASHHMHHAARYTALGDDIESRTKPPLREREAREHGIKLAKAGLHLNLHGYPAHEWTRPQSGYLPRGFELWSIPKGFFLILRHHPGHGGKARAFLEALTARVIETPGLRDFNQGQLAVWRAHAGEVPFPVINAIPCMITESDRATVPVTLITEYPDETIYGAPFQLAHETQYRTVLAAVELYVSGALD